jgi:RNA polymerase sigma-70 factor (ECF subfamily)
LKRALRKESDLSEKKDLGELYEALLPRVFSYVSYRVENLSETEDLVSKVFLHAAEKYAEFKWHHNQSFSAWIFKIAQNAIADFHRRRDRSRTPIGLDDLPEFASDEAPIEDSLAMKERFRLLRQLIGSLGPRAQEVITLRFFGGLSNQEIASVLNVDQRTVSAYLSRGLRELEARYLGIMGDEDSGERHDDQERSSE